MITYYAPFRPWSDGLNQTTGEMAFRSPFERVFEDAGQGTSSHSRSSSNSSECPVPNTPRVVGFPESPGTGSIPSGLTPHASGDLGDLPKRQSSLGHQLMLRGHAQDRQTLPRLRSINIKPLGRTRDSSRLNIAPGADATEGIQAMEQAFPQIPFATGTLPSQALLQPARAPSAGLNSDALPIPRG